MVSINSLEFVHNPAEALQEISRVLVPGGRAVIATFNKISPWGMTGVARLIRPEPDPSTPRFVSKADLTRLLKAAGLVVDGIKERACYLPSSSALGKLKLPLAGAFVAMVSKEAPKLDQSGERNPPKAKNFILEK